MILQANNETADDEAETMKKSIYDHLLDGMSPSLERAILRVLASHIGRENAVGRRELTASVSRLGFRAHERQVREAIKNLRREGFLICSAAGEDGGYYMAKDRQEYDEFRQVEFAAKITDMSETMRAMDRAAERVFGKIIQQSFF